MSVIKILLLCKEEYLIKIARVADVVYFSAFILIKLYK